MLILGLDPSLSCTGWGLVRAEGARLSHVANGQIATDAKAPMAQRLAALQAGLADVIAAHRPDRAAAEEVFVNKNPQSTLKLAQARGAVLAGYLSFKSYTAEDGEVIALSEWTDEASARAWGRLAEHRATQARGRGEFYASYTLFACDSPRIHEYRSKDEA